VLFLKTEILQDKKAAMFPLGRYGFRMKNNFSTAANWYQICLETGLTNNGEYHWAADELFWWTHMGTRNRHKNLAQDISDYHKQKL
jgi:hypothetical protein